jgi:hypothetical protein
MMFEGIAQSHAEAIVMITNMTDQGLLYRISGSLRHLPEEESHYQFENIELYFSIHLGTDKTHGAGSGSNKGTGRRTALRKLSMQLNRDGQGASAKNLETLLWMKDQSVKKKKNAEKGADKMTSFVGDTILDALKPREAELNDEEEEEKKEEETDASHTTTTSHGEADGVKSSDSPSPVPAAKRYSLDVRRSSQVLKMINVLSPQSKAEVEGFRFHNKLLFGGQELASKKDTLFKSDVPSSVYPSVYNHLGFKGRQLQKVKFKTVKKSPSDDIIDPVITTTYRQRVQAYAGNVSQCLPSTPSIACLRPGSCIKYLTVLTCPSLLPQPFMSTILHALSMVANLT